MVDALTMSDLNSAKLETPHKVLRVRNTFYLTGRDAHIYYGKQQTDKQDVGKAECDKVVKLSLILRHSTDSRKMIFSVTV